MTVEKSIKFIKSETNELFATARHIKEEVFHLDFYGTSWTQTFLAATKEVGQKFRYIIVPQPDYSNVEQHPRYGNPNLTVEIKGTELILELAQVLYSRYKIVAEYWINRDLIRKSRKVKLQK